MTDAYHQRQKAPAPSRPGLTFWIIVALAAGVAAGLIAGPPAAVLGDLGKPVIGIIKTVATPLVFFAIIDAVITSHVRGRSFLRLVALTTFNGSLALAIGLSLHALFAPGEALKVLAAGKGNAPVENLAGAQAAPVMTIDLQKVLDGLVPKSVVDPFLNSNVAAIVILALLAGFGLRAHAATSGDARAEVDRLAALNHTLLKGTENCIKWVIWLVPFAVFGVSAKSAGEHGLRAFTGLGYYVAVVLAGFAIQVGVVYSAWLKFYCRRSLVAFWHLGKKPFLYAFGCNSSLATLPLTLSTLDDLKVSRRSSTLAACVGTNLNNDGIILYEVVTALAVASASGIDLDIVHQLTLAGLCLVAAMGVAGVPEAGFVSLSLVLTTLNLPTATLPLLLSVDWLLARARSSVNTASDMVCSTVLDQMDQA
ncbi:dicarboxylate/amino acid:cation symporter [bacterium]|nr:dicarboxylate/amino acid:cation symporter [bacterium]